MQIADCVVPHRPPAVLLLIHRFLPRSWNQYWGNNGTFLIARGVNECGIESQAYAGVV